MRSPFCSKGARRDEPGPHSDVDFDLLNASGPREANLAHLIEPSEGWLTHVSVAVRDVEGWLAEAAEPAAWAFSWPGRGSDAPAVGARRLVTGVVELLQPHSQRLAPEFETNLPTYLANGTLQRYVAQEV
jgi:hypothetical protein